MKPYAKITIKNATNFKCLIGISEDNFNHVVKLLEFEQSEIKKHNHQKRRELITSKVSLEDPFLLTFYYVRHYPTSDNLACIFNISESYCQKIYTKIARMLVKILRLPSRNELLKGI